MWSKKVNVVGKEQKKEEERSSVTYICSAFARPIHRPDLVHVWTVPLLHRRPSQSLCHFHLEQERDSKMLFDLNLNRGVWSGFETTLSSNLHTESFSFCPCCSTSPPDGVKQWISWTSQRLRTSHRVISTKNMSTVDSTQFPLQSTCHTTHTIPLVLHAWSYLNAGLAEGPVSDALATCAGDSKLSQWLQVDPLPQSRPWYHFNGTNWFNNFKAATISLIVWDIFGYGYSLQPWGVGYGGNLCCSLRNIWVKLQSSFFHFIQVQWPTRLHLR